jgi:hypothetical protein
MLTSSFEKLLVFDIPDPLIGPTGNIGDELSEAPIGIPLSQLHDGCQ